MCLSEGPLTHNFFNILGSSSLRVFLQEDSIQGDISMRYLQTGNKKHFMLVSSQVKLNVKENNYWEAKQFVHNWIENLK